VPEEKNFQKFFFLIFLYRNSYLKCKLTVILVYHHYYTWKYSHPKSGLVKTGVVKSRFLKKKTFFLNKKTRNIKLWIIFRKLVGGFCQINQLKMKWKMNFLPGNLLLSEKIKPKKNLTNKKKTICDKNHLIGCIYDKYCQKSVQKIFSIFTLGDHIKFDHRSL